MKKIFVSYRGPDRSLVRQIESELKNAGAPYEFIDDIEKGDLREKPHVLPEVLKNELLKLCEGLLLLIGDTTHSPKKWMLSELDYAISKGWPVVGLQLPKKRGSEPEKIKNYKYYIKYPNEYSRKNLEDIVKFLIGVFK